MSATTTTTTANQQQQDDDDDDKDRLFGKFVIPRASIFYESKHSFAFVNLRPIVPGHVLVVPKIIKQHLDELNESQYVDLWQTVPRIQKILRRAYPNIQAFNVAVQDGSAAGQSVPHVHVHILPRTLGDYKRNDDIYNDLESWAPRDELQSKQTLERPRDRKDRTLQEMADEASSYRAVVEKAKLAGSIDF